MGIFTVAYKHTRYINPRIRMETARAQNEGKHAAILLEERLCVTSDITHLANSTFNLNTLCVKVSSTRN